MQSELILESKLGWPYGREMPLGQQNKQENKQLKFPLQSILTATASKLTIFSCTYTSGVFLFDTRQLCHIKQKPILFYKRRQPKNDIIFDSSAIIRQDNMDSS